MSMKASLGIKVILVPFILLVYEEIHDVRRVKSHMTISDTRKSLRVDLSQGLSVGVGKKGLKLLTATRQVL